MNEIFFNAFEIFARNSTILAVGALTIFLTLRLLRPRAPLTHRMKVCANLIKQGIDLGGREQFWSGGLLGASNRRSRRFLELRTKPYGLINYLRIVRVFEDRTYALDLVT
jgi:hypothetical protein